MSEQLHTTINPKKMSRSQLHCRHTKLIADQSMRMLKCELCELWIDPFDYIMKKAQGKVLINWQIEEFEEKRKELYAQVVSLKKEKSKVQRALRKLKNDQRRND